MDFDAPATAALDSEVVKPRWYAWLDILGDPVLATTAPANVTFPMDVADADLRGKTFVAYNPKFVDISEVHLQVGGASSVTASLSGLVLPDNALLNTIADPANWQGRIARLWMGIHDQTGVQQGAVVPYHGGYMSSLEIDGQPEAQTIACIIESFTASWSHATGRTYMDQQKYDPNDLSAEAALAAANGANGSQLTRTRQGSSSGTGGGGASMPGGGGGSGVGLGNAARLF
jgi:uncharacterized membrane protein YgcG